MKKANCEITGTKRKGYFIVVKDSYVNMQETMAVTEAELLFIRDILNKMFEGGEK